MSRGRFFEDSALYQALFGSRFALQSSDAFARSPSALVDDLLVLHIVFGKTVPDVSLNAVATSVTRRRVSSRPSIRARRFRPHRR